VTDPESLRVGYAIIAGGWALSLFAYGYLLIDRMQNAQRRRQLTAALLAFVVAVFFRVASLYASQPVMNPCESCNSAGGWLWWIVGCWSCP
jgi:hypothetical protein